MSKDRQLNLRLDAEDARRLRQLAKRNECTRSQMLRQLVRLEFEKLKEQEKK